MTITKDTFDMMRQAFWNSTKGDKLNHIELQLDEMTEEGFTVKVRVLTGCPGRTDLDTMTAHMKDLQETISLARDIENMGYTVEWDAELDIDEPSYRKAQDEMDHFAACNRYLIIETVKAVEQYRKEN